MAAARDTPIAQPGSSSGEATAGTDDAVAQAVAGLCSRLLEALHAGAPGAELGTLLDLASTFLHTAEIVLSLASGQLSANGTPCHPESSAVLRETLGAHGVRRVVLTRGTSARELLQFTALLADPPQEATGAIAHLWRAHGAWRIRLELTGETSARLVEEGIDASLAEASGEQALKGLLEACDRDATVVGAPDSSAFDAMVTPAHLRAVACLVGRGVSFAPDQPLGIVLRRARADGTRTLLTCLAAAPTAVERRRYFDAIASLQHGIEDLIGALGHDTWYVVRNAAMLLGDMRARAADQPLAGLLQHADARVRLAATQALATIGTDIAFLALETATRDPSMDVRVAAWSGLAVSPDTPSLPCFSDGLTTEPDPVAQRALLACLAEHPHPMAIALLVRFCARLVTNPRNGGIVCDALELLAQHRPQSVVPFLRRLQDMSTPATRSRIEVLQSHCSAA